MELIDIYDEENNPTGEIVEREKAHDLGFWHREVLIIIINTKNEVLLQKRSYKRRYLPGKWALCAGHIMAGETEKKAAIRELKEEINLEIKEKDLKLIETYKKNDPKNKKHSYVYLLRTDKRINEFKIQLEELTDLKYININKLIKLTKEGDNTLAFGGDKYHLELFTKIVNNTI